MFENSDLATFDDFCDSTLADEVFADLEKKKFEEVRQTRKGHYQHVFKSNNPGLPDENEAFMARFDLLSSRFESSAFNKVVTKLLLPHIQKTNPEMKYFLWPNVTRITEGCFFRSHTDSYAGELGYTLFFSRRWRWDYGGILSFVDEKDVVTSIFPHHGRLLLRNEANSPHHFVSTVNSWAKSPYYLAVGWASSKPLGDSDLRGDYLKIEDYADQDLRNE